MYAICHYGMNRIVGQNLSAGSLANGRSEMEYIRTAFPRFLCCVLTSNCFRHQMNWHSFSLTSRFLIFLVIFAKHLSQIICLVLYILSLQFVNKAINEKQKQLKKQKMRLMPNDVVEGCHTIDVDKHFDKIFVRTQIHVRRAKNYHNVRK